jgi:galactose mutarotase-like enzyme
VRGDKAGASGAPIRIASGDLAAEVDERGAELVRLQDKAGRDLLWDGAPAFWTGRAPLLFPMVGRARGDAIRINGVEYEMPQHGFARHSRFACVERAAGRCVMRLRSSPETLAQFPFPFQLDVGFDLSGPTLTVTAIVSNPGERVLPVSFGFHPAFRWPLSAEVERESHEIIFDKPEAAPIRRPVDGLLSPATYPSPVLGDRLPLADDLFRDGALIFDRLASRRVSYGAPGAGRIEVAFPRMPHLGIWTKPCAGFVCIEPWQGFASPEDFDGDFPDRPGVVPIGPGHARAFEMSITVP